MLYASVHNRATIRKIGWPKEGTSMKCLDRLILEAYELPYSVKYSCVDSMNRSIRMEDILAGDVKTFFLKYDTFLEQSITTVAEQSLFSLINPDNFLSGMQSKHEYSRVPSSETDSLLVRRRHTSTKALEEGVVRASSRDSGDEHGREADFAGQAFQQQIIKFERILAHLVNERTVLAWFRTNLAFVTLGLKYLKYGQLYIDTEYLASIALFICGGVFMIVLPFSWYSGYCRYSKCKEMIDYNIDQLGEYLYKMGFDYDNSSLGAIIFTSLFGIIFSTTIIIWTSETTS